MENIIPVAEEVVEFIKRGTESEQIALESLKTIAPVIKKQMTEQEKRERTIRKMRCETKTQCAIHMTTEKCYECRTCLAEMFYDAGYRKEEEVQKETLQKLFSSVSSLAETVMRYSSLESPIVHLNTLKILIKEEFGVEVEQ